MPPLLSAWDLLRQTATDPLVLQEIWGPILVLLPLLAVVLLVALRLACGGRGSRIALCLLIAVTPALFCYDLLLASASQPPDPVADPYFAAQVLANPALARNLEALGAHRQETRRLITNALILAGLAALGLPKEKPGKLLLPVIILAALAFAVVALLLLQRKIRQEYPQLPPGALNLSEFWQGHPPHPAPAPPLPPPGSP